MGSVPCTCKRDQTKLIDSLSGETIGASRRNAYTRLECPQLEQVQESARPQRNTIGERFMVKEEGAASVGTRPWTPEGRSLTLSIAFML
ncbi:hypothetical protein AVEN_255111-1 [Araneus ventricosus]|uniref:Uncharacterized protein n=1 Tax=Araneus ventricosus TaxID=182803 RepID=A0A4Y2RCT5_ARAVE|nr:hypothetical protein AVEN_255111-1 [Araneus ventricosus]